MAYTNAEMLTKMYVLMPHNILFYVVNYHRIKNSMAGKGVHGLEGDRNLGDREGYLLVRIHEPVYKSVERLFHESR